MNAISVTVPLVIRVTMAKHKQTKHVGIEI